MTTPTRHLILTTLGQDRAPATPSSLDSRPHNRLLASIPTEDARAVLARLRSTNLEVGATLYEAGTEISYVYFPVTAVVSLISTLQNGAGAEVAVVGHEGIVGVCAFMGGSQTMSSAVVQRSGWAWRMSARDIADLARDAEPVMRQLLRYTHVLFTHMAQTSACHSHHALAPKLCCWLLQHVDRQEGDELQVTHERMAGLLGVRREGVTEAAAQLQREGIIRYSRGRMEVLNKRGLEQRSCECYGAVKRAYEQLCGCGWTLPGANRAPRYAAPGRPTCQRGPAPLTLASSAPH